MIEQLLIERYNQLLVLGIPNPYNNSKFEWETEVKNKIAEMEQKLKTKS